MSPSTARRTSHRKKPGDPSKVSTRESALADKDVHEGGSSARSQPQSTSRGKQRGEERTDRASASTAQHIQRAPWLRAKGKRGKLQMMTEMPLDTLIETFKYLHPSDLLNLSLVSRAVRTIVMSRSTAMGIWKEVHRPPCFSLECD